MQKGYKKILVALELHPTSDNKLIQKAIDIAGKNKVKISLVHAIEFLGGYGTPYGVIGVDIEVENILLKRAAQEMAKLGKKFKIPTQEQTIDIGPAKIVILEKAHKMKADLIVVGSHGRHGARLILGSTANAVLHSTKCDVLAVRMKH